MTITMRLFVKQSSQLIKVNKHKTIIPNNNDETSASQNYLLTSNCRRSMMSSSADCFPRSIITFLVADDARWQFGERSPTIGG